MLRQDSQIVEGRAGHFFKTCFEKNMFLAIRICLKHKMSDRREDPVWRCYTKVTKASGAFACCEGCSKEMAAIVKRMIAHAGVSVVCRFLAIPCQMAEPRYTKQTDGLQQLNS